MTSPVGSGPLTPHEVLYEFDGPCIFTAYVAGRLVLAYLCDELDEEKLLRFIVVPTTDAVVSAMKNGTVSVREALERHSYQVLDLDHHMVPRRSFVVSANELPDDALPLETMMLTPPTDLQS